MDDHALRAWFEQRTAEHAFSGSALVWRDGGPVFRYWGGLAHRGHRVPVSDDTRFAVASVTKLPTAIAALRLVEQGRVRLDQPVVELLPADQWPRSLTPLHTLHHLLSQTSGIPNYHDDEDPTATVAAIPASPRSCRTIRPRRRRPSCCAIRTAAPGRPRSRSRGRSAYAIHGARPAVAVPPFPARPRCTLTGP